jgi:Leucine-rich repeat (LRR) protein
MKKNYFLLFTFFLLFNANAQVIEFKSSRFLEVLLYSDTNSTIAKDDKGNSIKIDENGDTKIQLSEALKVVELDISSYYLTDISGIENFTNLKTFICWGNYLTSFNINSLQELTYLNCSGIAVNSLDFTALINLETLVCTQTQLVSVNVTGLSNFTIFI